MITFTETEFSSSKSTEDTFIILGDSEIDSASGADFGLAIAIVITVYLIHQYMAT